MFDDKDDMPWFKGDEPTFPEHDDPRVMSMQTLRNTALKLFGRFLAHQNNLDPSTYAFWDDDELPHQFLSLPETETIVKEHSAADNGEMMAIGGNSPEEAMEKVNELMRALLHRILSNVVAEGVRRDFIDVAFDGDANDFAFKISETGMKLVDSIREKEEHDDSEQP